MPKAETTLRFDFRDIGTRLSSPSSASPRTVSGDVQPSWHSLVGRAVDLRRCGSFCEWGLTLKDSFINVTAPTDRTRPSVARAQTSLLRDASTPCRSNHRGSYNINTYLLLSCRKVGRGSGLVGTQATRGSRGHVAALSQRRKGRCPAGLLGSTCCPRCLQGFV